MTTALTIAGSRELVGYPKDFDEVMPMIVRNVNKELMEMVPSLTDWIRSTLYRVIPVRSGKLLDAFLQTLTIVVTRKYMTISALIPPEYPQTIQNPKHFGEEGWGPKYEPLNPIPNRVVIRATKDGKGKGNIYLLNDPYAESEYQAILGTYIFPIIRDTVPLLLSNYVVTFFLPAGSGVDDFLEEHLVSGPPGTVEWVLEDAAKLTGRRPTRASVQKVLAIHKWQLNDLELRTLWEQTMIERRERQPRRRFM